MNNASIVNADRTTHLKVIAVSLVASIAVVIVGIAARPAGPSKVVSHITISAPPQSAPVETHVPVKRVPAMVASRQTSKIW
jgi:hypothetical protein